MTAIVTLNELRNIQYQQQKPFSVAIDNDPNNLFSCTNITRCLPGKRISCQGTWHGKTVFAKLFIAPKRSKKHWQKELNGVELLSKAEICTPKLLHAGTSLNNKLYLILFEFITDSKPLQPSDEAFAPDIQTGLLHKLLVTLAEHHDKSLIQNDLHLNNFLLANNLTYTLDGSDITEFDNINEDAACKNLAQLFAQLPPSHDKRIESALKVYIQSRHFLNKSICLKNVLSETLQQREKRKQDFMAKTRRECSLFCVEKSWSQLAIYARKYQSNNLSQLIGNPDDFMNTGKMLKRGKTSTVSIVTFGSKQWVVKRYNIKGWIHFLSRAPRPSRALTSWHNANLLKFYGVSTPEPVAVIEKRFGSFRKTSYIISEAIQCENYWDYLHSSQLSDNEKELLAQSVCRLLRSLKPLMISHGDLKASNIMIENNKASLIDLDAMQQHSNQKSFQKAYKKDMNRFLKNWEYEPKNRSFFKKHCYDDDESIKSS